MQPLDSSGPILSVLDGIPVQQVAVDLGSGVGRIVEHLRRRGWTVFGCELDAEKAAVAHVDASDALTWNPPRAPQLVTCIELIEHLPQEAQEELIRRIRGWLTDGGLAIVSTPQRHSPVALIERGIHLLRPHLGPYTWWDPTHVSVLPRRRLERLFRETGFDILDRIGVHFAPDVLPVPGLRRRSFRGRLGAFGWDLVYVLAPSP